MKRILYFEIIDPGIRLGRETPVDIFPVLGNLFNGFAAGVGTDAKSALDDMLNNLQEYDISGLESQIKEEWEPKSNEGVTWSNDLYYHFGIIFKFEG